MDRPLLVDLFCGAGGAAMGYWLAGFDVVGVDLYDQPRYPFRFLRADAMTIDLSSYDAIHASPPCQAYSAATKRWGDRGHPDLIDAVRERIPRGTPYIIENVEGAKTHLRDPIRLCGSSFDLGVRRHRFFEMSTPVVQLDCDHASQGYVVGVYGSPGGRSNRDNLDFGGVKEWREAMGIDWMLGRELAEAIPPAYTQWLGSFLYDEAMNARTPDVSRRWGSASQY